MPDNRQVQSNGGMSNSSNTSVDNIGEAIRRLKIKRNDTMGDGEVGQSSPYPDRPGELDCPYYLRTGMCGYGSKCRYNHPPNAAPVQGGQYGGELPERIGQPDCGYFLKTGTCKYGSTCKYHHPRDRRGVVPVYVNMWGLPIRQEEKSCPYYMRTGLCKFGVACKFNHPQPASTGAVLPFPGPATYTTYGSTGSSVLPSSALPFVGALPAGSLPSSGYSSGPRLQGPSYLPVTFSPSQGTLPTQGWNTYMTTPLASSGLKASSNGLSCAKYLAPWEFVFLLGL
ncbi:unnamed protein product [Ilex paraguariensis]|uniref:C3H1-type domain-containing protein n=1 Tax=Ilex paraguariensis TaxID=185542 RepID=A0ABC8USS1_9AQUA